MQKIIIDEDFRCLLPKLDKQTYAALEANIIENGCRDSLVLWGDILIDGHNRYKICTEHNIPFNTVKMDFDSREDVFIWIIMTQVSRRNLTPVQLSYFRGKHYGAAKIKSGGRPTKEEKVGQNDQLIGTTATQLSSQYNVSAKTVRRDEKSAIAIDNIGSTSPEARRMILEGDLKIEKQELLRISDLPVGEIAEIAAQIEDGTYEKKKPESPETSNSNPGDHGNDSGGAYLGGSPDGSPGGLPDGLPGGYPGGLPDGYPGGYPGGFPYGLPDEFPNSLPGGFTDGLPDESPFSGSGGSRPSGWRPLDQSLISLTDDFSTELWTLIKYGDQELLKSALRSYIDTLEHLYGQM